MASDAHRRTPDHILAATRCVLGAIDLDPASDANANTHVQAQVFWSEEGLFRDWSGFDGCPSRVWLNPPGGMLNMPSYRGSSAAAWWAKLHSEFRLGHVGEALFLGFTLEIMRTAQRFACPPPQMYPYCIPKARLEFPSSNGAGSSSPAAASAVFYLGPNTDRFRKVFGLIGWCT
jgi:hypothetical protein